MSFRAVRWAYEQEIAPARGENSPIPRAATMKAVLVNLAFHFNERAQACWPGVTRIAEETQLDRHSVIAAIRQLKNAGLIGKVTRVRSNGQNRYELAVPPEDADSGVGWNGENGNGRSAGLRTPDNDVEVRVSGVEVREPAPVEVREPAHNPQSEPSLKNPNHRAPSQKHTRERAKRLLAAYKVKYQEAIGYSYVGDDNKRELTAVTKKLQGGVSEQRFMEAVETFLNAPLEYPIKGNGRKICLLCEKFSYYEELAKSKEPTRPFWEKVNRKAREAARAVHG